ncbi:hypothetical protein [Arenivirga flava]
MGLEKTASILGAARAGLLRTLVTDLPTARAVLAAALAAENPGGIA